MFFFTESMIKIVQDEGAKYFSYQKKRYPYFVKDTQVFDNRYGL